MALSTYSGLTAAIEGWLDRDDLTSQIDDFIDLAEARHKREVRIREMLVREPLIINNRYVALPGEYLEAKHIRILQTDYVLPLRGVRLEELTRWRSTTDGRPKFYTVHSQIEFDRSPDQTYTGEIIYYTPLDPLSTSNTSNDLLELAPDVYLYAALSASAPFLMSDERIATWEALYVTAKDDLNLLQKRAEQIGPAIATPVGTVV